MYDVTNILVCKGTGEWYRSSEPFLDFVLIVKLLII